MKSPLGGDQNKLRKYLSVEPLDAESQRDRQIDEPQFESDGGHSGVNMGQASKMAATQRFGANQLRSLDANPNLIDGRAEADEMRNRGSHYGTARSTNFQMRGGNDILRQQLAQTNKFSSERKKFERAPGTSEGLARKEVNQSVISDSAMNESSI